MDRPHALYILQLQISSDQIQFTLWIIRPFAWILATVCNWYPLTLLCKEIREKYFFFQTNRSEKMVGKTGYFNHFLKIMWGCHRSGNVEIRCETLKQSSWVKMTNKNSNETFFILFFIIHFINNHYFLFLNHCCIVNNILIILKFVCE